MSGNCNGPQNETGGKSLFIKKCKSVLGDSTAASNDLEIVAHGAKVGDIVKFKTIGANTTVTTSLYYFVVAIVDADTIEISATPGGTAILFDDTEVGMMIDLFRSVGGIRSKSLSFSSEGIDITNQDSDEWSTMLDKAGIRSVEFSGDGIYSNETVAKEVEDDAIANMLSCLAIVDVKAGRVYAGCFKITSIELGGSYDGEGTFSLSASSSGPVDFFRAS